MLIGKTRFSIQVSSDATSRFISQIQCIQDAKACLHHRWLLKYLLKCAFAVAVRIYTVIQYSKFDNHGGKIHQQSFSRRYILMLQGGYLLIKDNTFQRLKHSSITIGCSKFHATLLLLQWVHFNAFFYSKKLAKGEGNPSKWEMRMEQKTQESD